MPPGATYRYAFEVRDRAGLYWYHPHPHGSVARQTYDGLFGLIEVGDDEDRALRRALDVAPGETELVLVLQDRRDGARYAAGDADLVHGHFGPCLTVNGVERPQHAVATRGYRLRILNASNARTYRLGLSTASGARVPFTLLGTDGGLLAASGAVPRGVPVAGRAHRRPRRLRGAGDRRYGDARDARVRSDARRDRRGDARAEQGRRRPACRPWCAARLPIRTPAMARAATARRIRTPATARSPKACAPR